jgi:LmbE family N-acetylglucosaminyl deacetylase
MMVTVAVVASHPDDETLGCGGTLLKHKHSGDSIHWILATEMKERNEYSRERIKERADEVGIVAGTYGFAGVHTLGLSAAGVDGYPMNELVAKASRLINEIKPNIIYLPFKTDVHSDHRIIFNVFYSCTKSFRYPFIKKILMMETLSETEFAPSTKEDSFLPNVFVNVSDFMDKKIEIMNIYRSECGEHPFPRSERNIRALATLRGATAGCEYAESFMLLKEIN